MLSKQQIKTSKYLSLLLRHRPEKEKLDMDLNGYVMVKQLTERLSLNRKELESIVILDNKKRFEYSKDKNKLRACQGHSIDVDVELKTIKPYDKLYHGTSSKYIENIYKEGLVRKSRLYVHLSNNIETAINVGKRHVKKENGIVVITIDCKQMFLDGYEFHKSKNNVWLINHVPVKYMEFKFI